MRTELSYLQFTQATLTHTHTHTHTSTKPWAALTRLWIVRHYRRGVSLDRFCRPVEELGHGGPMLSIAITITNVTSGAAVRGDTWKKLGPSSKSKSSWTRWPSVCRLSLASLHSSDSSSQPSSLSLAPPPPPPSLGSKTSEGIRNNSHICTEPLWSLILNNIV